MGQCGQVGPCAHHLLCSPQVAVLFSHVGVGQTWPGLLFSLVGTDYSGAVVPWRSCSTAADLGLLHGMSVL